MLFERYVIGEQHDPYMIRWRLFECPLFRIYLHKICKSDDDRHLHDHPFNFRSVILWNGYRERYLCGTIECHPFMVLYRSATWLHQIVLRKDANGNELPAWTFVVAGRRLRQWGFQTDNGWVPYTEYEGAY